MAGILDLLLHGAIGYGQGRQQLLAERDAKAAQAAAIAREQANQDRQNDFEAAQLQSQQDAQRAAAKDYGLSAFMNHIVSVPTDQQAQAVEDWNRTYGTSWAVPGSVKTPAQTIPGRAATAAIPDQFVYPGRPEIQGPPSLVFPGASNAQGPPSLKYPGTPSIQGPPSIVHGRPAVPGTADQQIPEVDYPAYLDPAIAQHRAYIADQYRQGAIPPEQLQSWVQANNATYGDDWQVPMRSKNFGYKPDILSLLTAAVMNHAKTFQGQPIQNFVDPNGHIAQVPDLPVSPQVQSKYNQDAAQRRGIGASQFRQPPIPYTVPGGVPPMNPLGWQDHLQYLPYHGPFPPNSMQSAYQSQENYRLRQARRKKR